MDDFLINANLAGILLSIISGPIGCLVIWNRLAYLGDSIAHASLLGIVISIILGINIFWGGSVITILTLLLFINYHSDKFPLETILAIFSYTSLSIALILYSFTDSLYMNVETLLFGDILTITKHDIVVIGLYAIVALCWLKKNWNNLILCTINNDIAITQGINYKKIKLQFIIMVACTIVLSIKAVGVLLITSLIIIPASIARNFSKSPESMALFAAIIGICSTMIGLCLSSIFDTPSGPSIISISGVLFLLFSLIGDKVSKSRKL